MLLLEHRLLLVFLLLLALLLLALLHYECCTMVSLLLLFSPRPCRKTKTIYGSRGECPGINSGDNLSLSMEFMDGKLKQKGFFHGAIQYRQGDLLTIVSLLVQFPSPSNFVSPSPSLHSPPPPPSMSRFPKKTGP
jgi:hypothetical protein